VQVRVWVYEYVHFINGKDKEKKKGRLELAKESFWVRYACQETPGSQEHVIQGFCPSNQVVFDASIFHWFAQVHHHFLSFVSDAVCAFSAASGESQSRSSTHLYCIVEACKIKEHHLLATMSDH